MDVILRVRGVKEMSAITLKDTNYETVLEQIASAKKNSRLFEYMNHRTEERTAVDPNQIVYVIEKK